MKNDKKALLAYAKQNGWKYPKSYVWGMFSCFGGAIGGYLFYILIFFEKVNSETGLLSLIGNMCGLLILSFIGAFIGVIVGFIPASLTGWLLAKKEFVILAILDYGKVFLIGGLFGAIYGLVLALLFQGLDLEVLAFYGLFFMVLSGISAMICGKLFLPKAKI